MRARVGTDDCTVLQGSWAVLLNCHHAPTLLPSIEALMDTASQAKDTHAAFRLVLIAATCVDFPASVLQRGVKLRFDVATGLKAALSRCLRSEPVTDRDFYDGCTDRCGPRTYALHAQLCPHHD